jgi:hypothetical protein
MQYAAAETRNLTRGGCSLPGGPGGNFGWWQGGRANGSHFGQSNAWMTGTVSYDWTQAGQDVALLLALREARQRVLTRLVECSEDADALGRLVNSQRDMVFLIAEFFYALRAMNISSGEAVASFIDNHNRHIETRLQTEFRDKVGGFADRLKEGKFGRGAVRMIEMTLIAQRRLELSQSDIARFLVEVMSDETCRRVLAGLCDAGLLKTRKEEINRAVMIWSEGVLEAAFGQHLAEIRQIVASLT